MILQEVSKTYSKLARNKANFKKLVKPMVKSPSSPDDRKVQRRRASSWEWQEVSGG